MCVQLAPWQNYASQSEFQLQASTISATHKALGGDPGQAGQDLHRIAYMYCRAQSQTHTDTHAVTYHV